MSRNEITGQTKSSDGAYWRQLQFYKLLWEKARSGERVVTASLTFLTPERGKISTERFELQESDKQEIEDVTKVTLQNIYDFKFLDETCEERDCEFCRLAATIEMNK